ncbi:MAG: M28 family peptidase [Acidobacteriota bacterium]|nr:M28 family peptidase [Acidobacteriota bacterium]
MKRIFLIAFLLLLSSLPTAQTSAPAKKAEALTSNVVDAKQLLRDVEILASDEMQGRAPDTPGGAKAREYIVGRFKESGLKPINDSYIKTFKFGRTTQKNGTNVIGYVKGKKTPEKYIVVTAHYDHEGVKNGAIYNGADDNASGTAALFALAKYFSKNQPANSIIFAALDAEESGLQGSKKFVAEPPVKKESIVLNVNMDMISHNDKNELYAVGTFHYPFLKTYLEKVKTKAPVKLLFGHDTPDLTGSDNWTNSSDHAPFHAEKIPFIYFGVEDHKDYHKPTDDFANINREFYVRAVETVLSAVREFDANLAEIEKQKTKS